MTEPLVSAIIPTYNTRDCVLKAIGSALAQEAVSVEVIVVDDGSTDGTPECVERQYAGDARVRLMRQPRNMGPSAARNAGIAAARGIWTALLDADDLWRPDRLSLLLTHADRADFIADNLMGYDATAGVETGAIYGEIGDRVLTFTDFALPASGDRYDLGYLKPLVRRDFLLSHGLSYRDDVKAGEDLLYALAILSAGGRAFFIDRPLYVYTTPVGAVSGNASPHQRSTADTRPLIAALEQFRDSLGDRLSAEHRKALELRLSDLRAKAPIGRFHRAKAQRRYLDMLKLMLTEPAVRRRIAERLIGGADRGRAQPAGIAGRARLSDGAGDRS